MLKFLSFPSQNTVTSCSVSETGANSRLVHPKISNLCRCSSKTKYLSARLSMSNRIGEITMNSHGIGAKDAMIIVDHGSRRKEANIMLNKTGYPIVEPAHMFVCSTRGTAGDSPFSLSWKTLAPGYSLTAEAAREHPGISYVITAPLDLLELLVDVLNDRIKHC